MSPPNILVVVAHQMRWNSMRAAGDPNAKTPTLDALMRHGVYFDQAVATHSRSAANMASLVTGQYPGRHGVATTGDALASDRTPIWTQLGAAGYRTAVIGQLGFSPVPHVPDTVYSAEFGADCSKTDYHRWLGASTSAYPMPDFREASRDTIPALIRSKGCMAWPLRTSEAPAAWIADLALRFVQAAPEPFFLLLSFPDPHPPYLAPQVWLDQFPRSEIIFDSERLTPCSVSDASPVMTHPGTVGESDYRRLLAHYHAHLAHMDYHLGRVLATLNARGHTNNVVLFTAQHGETLGGSAPLFVDPDVAIDDRIRIPLILSGLQGQRANQRDSAPVESVDIAATVASVAGLSAGTTRDGSSLTPRAIAGSAACRSASYSETGDGTTIVRAYPYKLIQARGQKTVLHHVGDDPAESVDLIGQPRHVQAQVALTKSLRKIR